MQNNQLSSCKVSLNKGFLKIVSPKFHKVLATDMHTSKPVWGPLELPLLQFSFREQISFPFYQD